MYQKPKEPKKIMHEPATVLPNPDIPREQCIEQCLGCNKMYSDSVIGDVCIAYVNPKISFRLGTCALKSNKELVSSGKKKVNPLKASKRARRRGIR